MARISLQSHFYYQVVAEPPASTQPAIGFFESAWHQPWSDPMGRIFQARRQRLQVAQNTARGTFDPFPLPFIDVSVGAYYPPFATPVRKKKGLGAHLQSTTVIGRITEAEQVDESKWHQPWSEPKRFKRGLAPEQQHAFTTSPFPFTTPYARAYVIT